MQGDVIRLVDVNGSTAAYYEYAPYGNAIQASGSHANVNPLRYRGYVYDYETGLYYLQSRYYDPKIGRFLNADAFVATGQGLLGNNMFAYCLNNPVIYLDPAGNRVVGIGFQGDIQGEGTSVGVEIVVYFDDIVCDDADYLVVAYTYSGYEVSPGQLSGVLDLIDTASLAYLADNQDLEHDALMAMARTAVYGANLSGAVFLIDGYDNFDDVEDYSGAFETWSFSITPSAKWHGIPSNLLYVSGNWPEIWSRF